MLLMGSCLEHLFRAAPSEHWWALQDSNLQPTDYESGALTIELRAQLCATCRPY